MPKAVEPFEMHIDVQPEDIDRQGHVNNIVYVQWIQDAAVAHWRTIAPPGDRETILWVIRRHEIDYKRPAMPGDTVIVRTWIGNASRLRFERHTEILHAYDGHVLAIAKTVWCPLDVRTRKPVDVSPETRALFNAE